MEQLSIKIKNYCLDVDIMELTKCLITIVGDEYVRNNRFVRISNMMPRDLTNNE